MVRPLPYLLVLLVHGDYLKVEARENSRYLQAEPGPNHWGDRGGRSSSDRLERRKLQRKQLRQNTRADQESEQQSTRLTTTSATATETTPVMTTTTTDRVREIDDNDFPLMKNRELAGKNVEEADKFRSIPDLDSPAKHKRFRTKDMPVVERRKGFKNNSELQSERIKQRKNIRKEKRKMLGGEANMSSDKNFGTKKKYEEKNQMKTKLSQFVPSFSNSKHKGKRNKRKEFKMTEEKWNHSNIKDEGKSSSVRDRIELRKAKRNLVRKNMAGSEKFAKFPNNPKDLRKQKRKQNRQTYKQYSKLSRPQSQTANKMKQNHHQRQLTGYPEVEVRRRMIY